MATKCPVCGAPLENNTCEYCGYVEQNDTLQPQVVINNQIQSNIPPISSKKKITALLLCIFLGFFGIHRFYVGKIGTGILYLFTYGIFLIGWIIDIIKICNNSFTDKSGLSLQN